MVYCSVCGKKNEERAEVCAECGNSLYPAKPVKRDDCFSGDGGPEDECFGLPHGGAICGVLIGLFVIIWAAAIIFQFPIWNYFWPLMLFALGVLMIAGAIYAMSVRRKS
jgi:uncharacterized integral membrane protein